jgi:phage terminase large subunit
MASSIKPKKARRVAEMVEDPVRFAKSLLGLDLWSKQQEILQSVAARPRTAVKACHASGKTFLAAVAVVWFITRYREAIAVTTAPTWMQIERVLWREIHSIASRSKIAYPKPTTTSLQLGNRRYAVGLSTDQGVRFQGYHADHILVVIDEAPGILPEIWEAIEGIRAGGDVRVLALGNPTIASGKFHDHFHAERLGWNLHTISAWDTPNLAGVKVSGEDAGEPIMLGDPQGRDLVDLSEEELDDNVRPYLTTRRWVREKFLEWGPGHPLWEARVLGNFPSQSEDALLSLAWLEAAKIRECADEEPLQAGIDATATSTNAPSLKAAGTVLRCRALCQAENPFGSASGVMPIRSSNTLLDPT